MDVLSRRNFDGVWNGMIEPDVMISREEIAAFLGKLKKLRWAIDEFAGIVPV